MYSQALGDDTSVNDTVPVKSRPSGVLENAANAAAAAANAANAAAAAATAAANAANAALDAINSVIPQTSVTPPPVCAKISPTLSPVPPLLSLPPQVADKVMDPPVQDSTSPSVTGTAKFVVPEERSLVGLAGKFEIPVFVDSEGEFTKSLAGYQVLGDGPAGESSETNLAESIRAGRGFSRDNLIAGARADQAKAQTGQALALLLPSVSIRSSWGDETSTPSVALDPDTGRTISSETHSRTDQALVMRQPLFDLASYFDWRRRKVIEKARKESHRASDADAYVLTVNSYLSLVSSRLLADMTRDFESQLKELLVYVEKRAGAGAASVSDMARVRARTQGAISSRMEQESAHAAAGIEFVRLTNCLPRMVRLPELGDVGVAMLPESLDSAVSIATKSNPEITALASEVDAASIDKTAAKSRFLPQVALEYTDNYSLHAGGDTSSAGQKDKRLMVVMNWALFSGGGDYRYHNERSARYNELRYRLDDQRRRIVQTLSANYATLSSTKERISVGYQELKSISTAAEAMSKRMLSGNQSLLDLLDVYDRYYQARVRLVNLHTLEMNTVAQIVRLVQGVPGSDSVLPASLSSNVAPKEVSISPADKTVTPAEVPVKVKE